ncbi:hypothetical protein CFC21_090631 [Triticum aestivum]|uniref:Uncharacterized protein n=2 Tax=Triticum aestivum TaxID=4565 RepID=A0A3B6PU64_WHEAT|nr:uncharacterized protein At2g24330-like [Triticum aestivum]KAF7087446.1 hypothetical protein CFC21_090631 [Triticum aestivum]
MADAEAPAAKRLARAGSFSGVWWKLGDPAGDPAAVERRLRAVADEEAAVRARISRRHAGARGVRRGIAVASLAIEVVALVHAYWTARRRRVAGWSRKLLLLLATPLLAVPASAAVVLAAFARLHKMLDARDEQRLRALVAERKAKIGQFRGSHHNMQKLSEVSTKYDPDATAASSDQPVVAAAAAASGRIKRSHSRLSFHIGDD